MLFYFIYAAELIRIMFKNKKPAIGFIFITLLLDVIGFGIIIPVMPKLITQLIHGNLSEASVYGGWLLFSFSLMQFLFSPVLGNLSDKFGRRPILLCSLFGFGIDYLILAFAPNIMWLFIGRIFAGILGASFTTAAAYIADVSTPEKKAQNFGMIGAAFGLGFIIGPVIGGVMGQFGPRVPFIAAAIVSFINWLYGYFILPESLSKENRRPFDIKRANPLGALKQIKKYPLVGGLLGSMFFIYVASHAVQSNWSFFCMEVFHWNAAMVGYSLGFVGLLVALVQGGLIRYINPKIGLKKSVFVGFSLYITGFVLFAFCKEGWLMFVYLVPYCLGGIAGPALQGIISNHVSDNEQGEIQGIQTSLMSFTSIIGPPLMTNLFAFFTSKDSFVYFPGVSFLVAAFLTLVSLIFTYKTLTKFDHH